MNPSNHGSFPLLGFFCTSLQRQRDERKRTRVIDGFLSKFSPVGEDLELLRDTLFFKDSGRCTKPLRINSAVDAQNYVRELLRGKNSNNNGDGGGASCRASDAFDFAPSDAGGTLSIVAALRFMTHVQSGTLTKELASMVVGSCMEQDFILLLALACGQWKTAIGLYCGVDEIRDKLNAALENAFRPAAIDGSDGDRRDGGLNGRSDVTPVGVKRAREAASPEVGPTPASSHQDDDDVPETGQRRAHCSMTVSATPASVRSSGLVDETPAGRNVMGRAAGAFAGLMTTIKRTVSRTADDSRTSDHQDEQGAGGQAERMEDGEAPVMLVRRESSTKQREPCKYGTDCRRKNPLHFKQYWHSGDPVEEKLVVPSAAAATTTTTTTSHHPVAPPASSADTSNMPIFNGIVAKQSLPEFQFIQFDGVGGATYKIKNCSGGTFTCSCPVWRYQNKATNERSCKHLRQYLGDAYEDARCGGDTTVAGATTAAVGRDRQTSPVRSPPAGGGGKKFPVPGGSVLLAQKAPPGKDFTGWWISEKLDGVRAIWDGERLITRNGNLITAPGWFTAKLPSGHQLDGELFLGRAQFQATSGVVRSGPSHAKWKDVRYEVFDIPSIATKPFEQRLAKLEELIPLCGAHVHLVQQSKCTSKSQLDERLREVEAVAGEGLMLRQPGSMYVHCRSPTLLKVKSCDETDAIIRGYDKGKGKNVGRVGALSVELANGKQFCVGSGLSDAQRTKPPPIGTVIVVKHNGVTDGGIPRFPVFGGSRYDIDWAVAIAEARK